MIKCLDEIVKMCLKAKKIVLSKKILTIVIINIITMIVLLWLGAVQFETIDDYMIYELLSGKWGQATSYTIYVNIILSSMLVLLFKILPSINWYVLMLLITHIISFTVLGNIISKKYDNGLTIYLLVLIVAYIPFLIFLQYTSQAAILILTGFIYASNIITNRGKKLKLILPFAMILFGTMIRFGAIMYIIPYVLLMFVIKIIMKKYPKSEIILRICFCLITLLVCCLFKFVHNSIYNTSPIYKEYLEYSNVRVLIHDYLGNNYDANEEVYNSVGWSSNDYMSMALFNNADDMVFNIENMQYIIQNVTFEFPNFLRIFWFITRLYFLPYLFILIGLVYISVKQGNKESILILAVALVIEFAFLMMWKANIRTCTLNYIVAIIFIVNNLEKLKFKNKLANEMFAYITIFILTIIVTMDVGTVISNKDNSIAASHSKFIEYVNENKDNAYVYSRVWFK